MAEVISHCDWQAIAVEAVEAAIEIGDALRHAIQRAERAEAQLAALRERVDA
jgi:hypothetical protein